MRKVAKKIRKKGAAWARHGKHKHRLEVVRYFARLRRLRVRRRILQGFNSEIAALF